MPLLSSKRQVTIPKALCDRLHVQPHDEIDFVEHEGRITLIKKRRGASAGVLKHLKGDSRYSDEESVMDALAGKQSPAARRRRPT